MQPHDEEHGKAACTVDPCNAGLACRDGERVWHAQGR